MSSNIIMIMVCKSANQHVDRRLDIISYTSATFHTHSYRYIVNIIILYGLGHNYLSHFASPILCSAFIIIL